MMALCWLDIVPLRLGWQNSKLQLKGVGELLFLRKVLVILFSRIHFDTFSSQVIMTLVYHSSKDSFLASSSLLWE